MTTNRAIGQGIAILRRSAASAGAVAGCIAFLRCFLRDPRATGSALPSGAAVGRAVAPFLELDRPGHVVELGAGTGNITRALLRAGCPPSRLLAIERDPDLARHLRRRFPDLCVVDGDAAFVGEIVRAHGVGQVSTVVSSLPIRWFPPSLQDRVLGESLRLLGDGPMLQLTNGLKPPVDPARLDCTAERVGAAWWNLLPIQIWRYSRKARPRRLQRKI